MGGTDERIRPFYTEIDITIKNISVVGAPGVPEALLPFESPCVRPGENSSFVFVGGLQPAWGRVPSNVVNAVHSLLNPIYGVVNLSPVIREWFLVVEVRLDFGHLSFDWRQAPGESSPSFFSSADSSTRF